MQYSAKKQTSDTDKVNKKANNRQASYKIYLAFQLAKTCEQY